MSEPQQRVAHRNVVMKELTPHDGDEGYLMHGDTEAETKTTDKGVYIREKRARLWKFMTWTEVWINAIKTSE